MKIKLSIANKLFLFSVIALTIVMIPLFFLTNQALKDLGNFADKANTRQIRDISKIFLMEITREKVKKFNEKALRYQACIAFLAKKAQEIYNQPAFSENLSFQFSNLALNQKNHIFYTPESMVCQTAYWGGKTMDPDILKELHRLSSLDSLMETASALTGDLTPVHITTLSGIGKYYTHDPAARAKYFNLPIPCKADLRDEKYIGIFKTGKTEDRIARMTEPYLGIIQNKPQINAVAPFFDKKGVLRGGAGIDLPMDRISSELNPASSPERFSFILDLKGRVIALPRQYTALLGLPVQNPEKLPGPALADSSIPGFKKIARAIQQKEGRFFRVDTGKTAYLMMTAPFVGKEHMLVEVVSEKTILESVVKTRFALGKTLSLVSENFLIFAELTLILAFFCIYILLETFIRPIKNSPP
ncbi:MAG: cache domain-containing protein [Desulfobacter sp.]|nr:cache domain-containing protein [Desulfobacter sp.]WDP84476.1 MAG: cache domain-containing protein [Desulfobacter sp.]